MVNELVISLTLWVRNPWRLFQSSPGYVCHWYFNYFIVVAAAEARQSLFRVAFVSALNAHFKHKDPNKEWLTIRGLRTFRNFRKNEWWGCIVHDEQGFRTVWAPRVYDLHQLINYIIYTVDDQQKTTSRNYQSNAWTTLTHARAFRKTLCFPFLLVLLRSSVLDKVGEKKQKNDKESLKKSETMRGLTLWTKFLYRRKNMKRVKRQFFTDFIFIFSRYSTQRMSLSWLLIFLVVQSGFSMRLRSNIVTKYLPIY